MPFLNRFDLILRSHLKPPLPQHWPLLYAPQTRLHISHQHSPVILLSTVMIHVSSCSFLQWGEWEPLNSISGSCLQKVGPRGCASLFLFSEEVDQACLPRSQFQSSVTEFKKGLCIPFFLKLLSSFTLGQLSGPFFWTLLF